MTIEIPQSDGYTRQELWEKTDLYCLNCGKQTVWNCPDNMDYDSGESECCCTSCKYSGYGTHWSPENDLYVIDRLINPHLPQPKHNPRPPSEMEKYLWRMMAKNIKRDMEFLDWFLKPKKGKGKVVTFMRYEQMKPLDDDALPKL